MHLQTEIAVNVLLAMYRSGLYTSSLGSAKGSDGRWPVGLAITKTAKDSATRRVEGHIMDSASRRAQRSYNTIEEGKNGNAPTQKLTCARQVRAARRTAGPHALKFAVADAETETVIEFDRLRKRRPARRPGPIKEVHQDFILSG